jgi:histidine phosphotransferase ChpT
LEGFPVTGMSEALCLAEMLCARLCHDLSSLLGSLIGVIEIAREEHSDSEILTLAEDTAVQLGQRLKLLRAAWAGSEETLDLIQLQTFADSLSNSRRLRLDLGGLQPETAFPPPAAHLILNILLLAAESLPVGGIIALSGSAASNILVTIAGTRAAWPPGFATYLADEKAAWSAVTTDARKLQAPLTALLARQHGFRLSLLMDAGTQGGEDAASPLLLSAGN